MTQKKNWALPAFSFLVNLMEKKILLLVFPGQTIRHEPYEVERVLELTKGKGGGGRKDFAQAGGQDQSSLDCIYEFILDKVKNINN